MAKNSFKEKAHSITVNLKRIYINLALFLSIGSPLLSKMSLNSSKTLCTKNSDFLNRMDAEFPSQVYSFCLTHGELYGE
ncbi:MAG: hypothetical protein MHPSP_003328, partial [Paramarteilia canceri]